MEKAPEQLKELLESGHSKAITNKVIELVGEDPLAFDALMELFFSDDWCMNQRASWPIPYIVKKHPHLIDPYLARMVEHLEHPVHNAVVRNSIRLFQDIQLPDGLEGKVYQICFNLLRNIKEPVANKVFAMTVMYNIGLKYPELLTELKIILENQIDYEKAGFKSRGRKILTLIDKRL